MSNQNPNPDELQHRVDELAEDIDTAQEQADEPKLDVPEVTQDRTFRDPDGDGDPDGPSNVMTG